MIAEAISALRPGAQWSLNGEAYAGLIWNDQQQQQPTQDEITAWIAANSVNRTKDRLKKQVDFDAELIRLRYITPGSGMAMTYAEKRDQAAAVHAAGEAAANALTADQARDAYPTLAASIGVEAPTLWACAQLVIAKAEAWADLSYSIERVRMVGKKAISDASDAAAAQAAYEAIAWPT